VTFTPDTLYALIAAVLFAGFVAVILLGAVVAVAARSLVRNVTGLALSFLGLAGLYYFLHSPFLALMQILIYVGAICVTIMFAMMLAELHEESRSWLMTVLAGVGSFVAASAFAIPLILMVRRSSWMPASSVQTNPGTIEDLGRALLTRYGFAFELISVVLLLAILGALAVARSGRKPNS
jgi:NADH:ubiquinone oxidoreductase subunit 6 (subunit J)